MTHRRDERPADRATPVTAGSYHLPVLLTESVEALITDPNGIYVDATFGGGGHSAEILRRLGSGGHLFGLDRDPDAAAHCALTDDRFTFVPTDFRYLPLFLRYFGLPHIDGLIADLGVSSHHFDEAARGFSFRYAEAPIDMRMNQSVGETARDLILRLERDELAALLRRYGEVKAAGRAATLLKSAIEDGGAETMGQLVEALIPLLPAHDHKLRNKLLSQILQALRIAVNDEMGALHSLLHALPDLLKPGGRAVFLTYHSLEDRPVKYFFRTGNIDGERRTDLYGRLLAPLHPLTTKPLLPSDEEIERNPRARSAKLRIAERIAEED